MESFAFALCTLLAPNIPGLTFGPGDSNVKVGELVRGIDGVFVVEGASPEPDRYTAVEYHTPDFWAVFKNAKVASDYLRAIYDYLHQKHHYNTDSYTVHFSYCAGQILDLDRDGEGRKMLKLSVAFIITGLIS